MKVKDIMEKEVIKVGRSMSLRELLGLFKDFHTFPLVPVVEEDGKLAGVVYLRNLLDVFRPHRPQFLKIVPFLDEEKEDIFASELTKEMGDLVIVEDIMETKFICMKQDLFLEKAYNLMKLHGKEQLPVVDDENRLVGMIGMFDIVVDLLKEKGVVE